MKKLLLFAGAAIAMSFAAPAYGAACVNSTLNLAVTCEITQANGAVIQFSGFSVAGLPAANTQLSVDNSAFTGVGFTFTGAGGVSFLPPVTSVSYTATILTCPVGNTCAINFTIAQLLAGAGATATTNFASNVLSTGTGLTGTTTGNGGQSISLTSTFTSNGNGGPSFEADLLASVTPPTGTTPEPTSMILFGSGFLAVGLAARKRRKA